MKSRDARRSPGPEAKPAVETSQALSPSDNPLADMAAIAQSIEIHRSLGGAAVQEMTEPGDRSEREAASLARRMLTRLGPGGAANHPTASPAQLAAAEIRGAMMIRDQGDVAGLKAAMGQAVGRDFSDVRFHTDSNADTLCDWVGAKAVTHDKNVYFKRGELNPRSQKGREALAHELSHTTQDGAETRLAAWWTSGHQAITLAVGQQFSDKYHPAVLKYLSRKSGIQDTTVRSLVNFAVNIPKSKKRMKNYLSEKSLEEKEKMWENLTFHIRWDCEMPFHGEAGAYREAGKDGDNAAAVTKQVDKAANHFNNRAYREGIHQLADALHSAEDRGSHGEGAPYTGHDPRLSLPFKFDGTPNEKYLPGWDCDNPSMNSGGRVLGEQFAAQVYQDFWHKLTPKSKVAIKQGKGGWSKSRGVRSKVTHPTKLMIGHLARNAGPEEGSVKSQEQYTAIRRIHKGGDSEEANRSPVENMKRFFSLTKREHGEQLLDAMQKVIDDLRSGAHGPAKLEKSFGLYTKINKLGLEIQWAIKEMNGDELFAPLLNDAQLINMSLMSLIPAAAEWAKRASTSGFTKKSTRTELKNEILQILPGHLTLLDSCLKSWWKVDPSILDNESTDH